MQRYFAIELGGTKINVAAGASPDDLSAIIRIETRSPHETMKEVVEALTRFSFTFGMPKAIGIASFGPIAIDPAHANYGTFLNTPKAGWSGFNLMTPIREAFSNCPIALDTDVNGAALSEGLWGAAKDLSDYAYVTIGTGLGVGVVSHGQAVHGLLHPEAGHMLVRRTADDPFEGACPFHGDCLEGLISGPALKKRLGFGAENLAPDDPEWDRLGHYLAQGLLNICLLTSAQKIMIGGGVGLNAAVMGHTRDHLHRLLGGYIEALKDRAVLDNYVVPAALGDKAGILGAIVLAQSVCDKVS
jgi:fructokinase